MPHLRLWGNVYAQIIRNGPGEIIALHPLGKKMTLNELIDRYMQTRTGVKPNTLTNYSFVKNLMVMDDDIIMKDSFAFQLAGVVVNTEHTREAITKEQMRKFFKFVYDDNVYCKYYEVFYILFHTELRISEFCGLTIKDLERNLYEKSHYQHRPSASEIEQYGIPYRIYEDKRRNKEDSDDGRCVPNVPGDFGRQTNRPSGGYG